MNIIDISWPITPHMTAYKDKKVVAIEHTKTFERDQVRESVITLGAHTGTHIDAPAHFVRDGVTIETLPLTSLIGPCKVLDCTTAQVINDGVLKQHTIAAGDIVLLKTWNSLRSTTQQFDPTFVYLDASGASYLVACGVKAVGIDYLGIERNQPDHETHITLMRHGIIIIEGLRLQAAQPKVYQLWCLPLALQSVEAAPARAILID